MWEQDKKKFNILLYNIKTWKNNAQLTKISTKIRNSRKN